MPQVPLKQRAVAQSQVERAQLSERRDMDSLTLVHEVMTTYLGDHRVRIASGDRILEVDQRTHTDRPGAGFCPLELVAAALGA